MEFNKSAVRALCVAMLATGLMAGCGDKKEENAAESGDKATQVAAKVNGTELTVHQVNFALQNAQNVTQENSKQASKQILRSLVDQELLVQQALADKLDRDPMVVQAMDAARRKVLAEVYVMRKLGTPTQPSDADVDAYYKAHPELFSARKLYQFQELIIPAKDDASKASIQQQMAKSKNLKDFAAWLQGQKIEFKAAQGVKSPEQMPSQLLAKVSTMPVGQAVIVNVPDGLSILILAATKDQPVPEDKAKPVIAQLLVKEKRQEAVKAEIEALRSKAKIEYVGEFSDAGEEAAAPAPAPAQKPAEAGGAEEHKDGEALNKGLSGL